MEPISGTGIEKRGSPAPFLNSSRANPFSDSLKLAKADGLLRPTDQYGKWMQIRQRNDDLAVEIADILLKRHALVDDAAKDQPVDQNLFDTLTKQLEKNDIHLFKSDILFKKEPAKTKTSLKRGSESGLQALMNQKKTPVAEPKTKEIKPDRVVSEKIHNTENRPFQISNETLLVLSAEYRQYLLNNGLVGYGDSKNLYLPLEEITRTLDFSIDVDSNNGTASGWFVSENRKFNLDLSKGQVISDGNQMDIPKGAVVAADNEFYVNTKQLSRWFPVDFKLDFPSQSVKINPREKLPFQAKIEREQAWKSLKGNSQLSDAKQPRMSSEYKWLSVPAVDIGITGSYTDGTDNNDGYKSSFYVLSKGDLGKMTSEIYLAGENKDGLNNTRLTLKKEDPDGKLLGPLKAKSVAIGDIRTVNVPVLGGGETEKGFSISNKDLHRSREFDTTFFEGNLPPGWDVEVYRNKILINSTRVEGEGKYKFNDIPVYYGMNDFELIFYGPQGQKKTESKRINVGGELLKKGKSEYNVSISQNDTNVYDPDKTSKTVDDGSLKLSADYNYGLNKNLSVGAGVSSREIFNERHDYLNTGVKGNFKGIYLSGDLVHDTKGGDAIELLSQTRAGNFDLRLKQRFYNNFIDDREAGSLDPLKSKTDISISGLLSEIPLLPDIPFTLSYQENKREDSGYRALSSRLAGTLGNVRLNNYLKWTDTDSLSGSSSVIDGNLQASTQLGDHRLRGQLDYGVDPETEITSTQISHFYNISNDLSSELFLKKELDENDDISGTLKFNWNNGDYILSPQVSYNSNGEASAFLSFSTSLGMEPRSKKIHASSMQMADKGAVSVRVFNDKNNNKVFDRDDKLIEGATIKAPQSFQEAQTNEQGIAFLSRLEKNKPTDIILDKDTLEDPFWEPSTPGRSILPRPGHAQLIDIPVVTTGEIDGTVLTKTHDGKEKPLPNILVQLLDEKGDVVQSVRSEYDGFYYFPKVFPGNYSVRIDPDETQSQDRTSEKDRTSDIIKIEIDTEGSVASGKNLFLKKEAIAVRTEEIESRDIRLSQEKEGLSLKTDRGKELDRSTKKPQPIRDSQNILTNVLEREQLQKDFRKLKTEYDRLVKSEEGHEDISISKSGPIKQVNDVKAVDSLFGQAKVGLHLSSYRTPQKAAAGIKYLIKMHKNLLEEADFTIRKVKVSDEKGIWYRVIAGSFKENEKADQLGKNIKLSAPYCKVISSKHQSGELSQAGVHLTSVRTQKNALQSIANLKRQYPSLLKEMEFTIKNVDLGPEMGKWKRIIAGRFENKSGAKILAQRIKMKLPYCKTIEIEKENELGLHLASYRTLEKASEGLKGLQKKYGALIKDENFSIRRTNLGKDKGVWYRIISGNFQSSEPADVLKQSLNKMNQYARIIKF